MNRLMYLKYYLLPKLSSDAKKIKMMKCSLFQGPCVAVFAGQTKVFKAKIFSECPLALEF